MAKYTVGQEVWFQVKNGEIDDIFVMPGSTLNLKGEVVAVDGNSITVRTNSFGEVKTDANSIEDGAKMNAKIEKMREEQAQWDAAHATDEGIRATRVS